LIESCYATKTKGVHHVDVTFLISKNTSRDAFFASEQFFSRFYAKIKNVIRKSRLLKYKNELYSRIYQALLCLNKVKRSKNVGPVN